MVLLDGFWSGLIEAPGAVPRQVEISLTVTRNGLAGFLAFFASINIVLGLVNLIPLPPLDGGHIAVATYERIRSRKGRRYQVDMAKLLPLTYAVVMVLVFVGLKMVWLNQANAHLFGRVMDDAGLAYWSTQIARGTSKERVVRSLASSTS